MSAIPGIAQLQLGVCSFTPLSSDVIVYELSVTYGSQQWRIKYRFSKYKELHDELKRTHKRLPAFPPKWIFTHTDPKHLETRRKELDVYLKALGMMPAVVSDSEFLNFIDLRSHLRSTAPPSSSPASSPSLRSPAGPPAFSAAPASRAPSPPPRSRFDTMPAASPPVPRLPVHSLDDFEVSSEGSPDLVLLGAAHPTIHVVPTTTTTTTTFSSSSSSSPPASSPSPLQRLDSVGLPIDESQQQQEETSQQTEETSQQPSEQPIGSSAPPPMRRVDSFGLLIDDQGDPPSAPTAAAPADIPDQLEARVPDSSHDDS